MNFFTLDWYDGDHTDEEWRALFQAFDRHVQEMRTTFPEPVVALQELDGVDDGLLIRVLHDRERRRLALTLRCGDLRIGYYDLAVTYEGAAISPEDDRVLARVARTTRGHRTHVYDIAYHELGHALEGRLEHGFLFHPGVCFSIRCDALQWERINRPDRKLPPYRDRYPGGPGLGADEINQPEPWDLETNLQWARGRGL